MFLQLYRHLGGDGQYQHASSFLEAHPFFVELLMDLVWALRDRHEYPSSIKAFPFFEGLKDGKLWLNHLIYAYIIENTRIYEIFEKAIFEYLHGEKLGFPVSPETVRWLRTTEDLFYKSSSNYFVQSFASNIRPDFRSSRRNAYSRMFGIDLNHGTGTAANYPYLRPSATNKDFVSLFEEFLSEVWIGITNVVNFAGANPTDDSKMSDLIRRIRELLTTRRQYGNLTREEFFHVATMSWMHLTLYVDDAPVVQDMGIVADSPAERLRQMGERVGFPAHPKADAFFQMAEDISCILVSIEHQVTPPGLGLQNVNPHIFYAPGGALVPLVGNVITQWSIATGRDLKSLKVRPATVVAPVVRQETVALAMR